VRTVAGVIIALLLGAALGVASAWVAVDRFALSGEVRVGQWRGNLFTGSSGADPYTRAAIAKTGLLALARSETVYFFRDTDETGAPLDARCTYRLRGADLPARWWSVTLYDEAFFLARNEDNAHSVDATKVGRGGQMSYEAVIGPAKPASGLWLSSAAAKLVRLTVRLYNPQEAVQDNPANVVLPTVEKVSCPDGVEPGGAT
jgi:hypothetical protein